jgi:phosphate transport system protein
MNTREHFSQQLRALHAELRSLGQQSIAALRWSLDALNRNDQDLAARIIRQDDAIDQAHTQIEDHALMVIATQSPVASDLRLIIATIHTAGELERVADYAKTIARVVQRNTAAAPIDLPSTINEMATKAIDMIEQALEAFIRQDSSASQQLAASDDQVDALERQTRAELISRLEQTPQQAAQLADLLTVSHSIERIADRATNIAERAVFMVSGDQVELNS